MSPILEHIKSHLEEELRQTKAAEFAEKAAAECKRCAEALIGALDAEEKAIHDKWVEAFKKKNSAAN